ncbi:MAG: MBL fold metallo-hydrolase [Lachnospiraceae bacterium]|nr:MBL fold metallo-hydrolase [Lachnospiraceae bacterium]
MELWSIASGSSGNCIYAASARTQILIDAGISAKRIEQSLASREYSADDLSAILITHEHSDHIQGVSVLARRHHIPIYATEKTVDALLAQRGMEKMDESLIRIVEADRDFSVGDLTVHPFANYHDAADPVCYTVQDGRVKIAVATDRGHYDDYTVRSLSGCEAMLIEANHDRHMLEVGPYPYPLKLRILSDTGHLSNDHCGKLLCELYHEKLQYILLGHLSKENNLPELAYETVRFEMKSELGSAIRRDLRLGVAKRDVPSGSVIVS